MAPTALENFVTALRQGQRQVRIDVLLQMAVVRAHEELLAEGHLTAYQENLGRAMFVSHEWMSADHPDPKGEQLNVLQDALRNLLSGSSRIRTSAVTELCFGRVRTPTPQELREKSLYVWYDYLCCPQGSDAEAVSGRQWAIDTIGAYVARCQYFVVLCPALAHHDHRQIIDTESLNRRAWCRAERLARELGERGDGQTVVIESAGHQSLVIPTQLHLAAPGTGELTFEQDRPRIRRLVLQMIWKKLLYFLERGDLHSYRFLLNKQYACCLKGLDTKPLEGLIPDFRPQSDPFLSPGSCAVERFLHENGFCTVQDRDTAGWTPLCYAVMTGDASLVAALLEHGANSNDSITKSKRELLFPKKMSLLSIAAHFRSNETLNVLLAARADVNARDSFKTTALHWVCTSDNSDGLQLLADANGDLQQQDGLGFDIFKTACANGSYQILTKMLAKPHGFSLRSCLHLALLIGGGSRDAISLLISAKADVNETLDLTSSRLLKFALTVYGVQHRVRPSRLTMMAYHHGGCTPLMLSILNGYFGATLLLLEARAQVDKKNSRGRTALQLAQEAQAPSPVFEALKSELQSREEDATEEFVSI
ncbi:hypothetical protein AK812_SmicGene24659 [Symbiodinium microadriaticum]|uniref:Uncharacterized protein n=1 Tax=Symbiodinium microadriaticum TaxID=2951 RepID=A0A1Q9DE53_SYMMI|nr:hypothetical protein AK812_SmicGene24659 [Symbiodinium microadriaticum]